jgi:TusA-related sulfurtransferase
MMPASPGIREAVEASKDGGARVPGGDAREPGRADQAPTGRVIRFDAGWMGRDVMPMQIRRQLQAVEVGDVVEFVVYDPSSKEDTPSFARMLGHRVRSMEQQDDGALVIAVERAR